MGFNPFASIVRGLVDSITGAANTFIQTPDEKAAFRLKLLELADEAEARSQNAMDSARDAYKAEWQYGGHDTKFDSFVDGMNRLVRPVVTYGLLAAVFGFIEIPDNLDDNIWLPLTTVLAFWFGGRLLKRDGGVDAIKAIREK